MLYSELNATVISHYGLKCASPVNPAMTEKPDVQLNVSDVNSGEVLSTPVLSSCMQLPAQHASLWIALEGHLVSPLAI